MVLLKNHNLVLINTSYIAIHSVLGNYDVANLWCNCEKIQGLDGALLRSENPGRNTD